MAAPDPDVTGFEQCEPATPATYCDLDITNNVWVEGVVDPAHGKRGICMLDSLSERQIVDILQHDPRAREDLPRVTSSAELLQLLATTRLLPAQSLEEQIQERSNRNPNGIPFYTVFRGRAPAARR